MSRRIKRGRKYTEYVIINTEFLMEFFEKSRWTIYRWIKSGKLIPTDINQIVQLKQQLTE